MLQTACRRFTGASSAGGVAPTPFADSESIVGIRRGGRSGTRSLPHCHDLASGVRQAEAHDEAGCARQAKDRIAGGVPGVGRAPSGACWARADGVCGLLLRQPTQTLASRGRSIFLIQPSGASLPVSLSGWGVRPLWRTLISMTGASAGPEAAGRLAGEGARAGCVAAFFAIPAV
jgi:hypothetical protein